ncbi:hypothetical protein EVAR_78926_1 [Eumeta japonica]|uniref:Uncharacterized protein n=1 Tax=Eumeta variegata TaxID=151549 RepID=A0A4C1U357_EUMVA|nr:hypothetical protein EVAR_78926_1 [Eumeta japonica]
MRYLAPARGLSTRDLRTNKPTERPYAFIMSATTAAMCVYDCAVFYVCSCHSSGLRRARVRGSRYRRESVESSFFHSLDVAKEIRTKEVYAEVTRPAALYRCTDGLPLARHALRLPPAPRGRPLLRPSPRPLVVTPLRTTRRRHSRDEFYSLVQGETKTLNRDVAVKYQLPLLPFVHRVKLPVARSSSPSVRSILLRISHSLPKGRQRIADPLRLQVYTDGGLSEPRNGTGLLLKCVQYHIISSKSKHRLGAATGRTSISRPQQRFPPISSFSWIARRPRRAPALRRLLINDKVDPASNDETATRRAVYAPAHFVSNTFIVCMRSKRDVLERFPRESRNGRQADERLRSR